MSESTTTTAEFDSWMSRASAAMATGRNEDALECLSHALNIRPKDVRALNARGAALGALGRFEDAVSDFKCAIAEAPTSPVLHYNVAFALQSQQRFSEALSNYDSALVFLPTYAEALHNRGLTLDALGRYDDAVSSIEKARILCPQDARLVYNLGRIHLNAQNFPDAKQAFEAALRIASGFQEARIELGRCQIRLLELEPAIRNFELVLEADPADAGAIEGIGMAFRLLERNDELARVCRELVARAPNAVAPIVELGATLASLGKRDEANECFSRAVELGPKNAVVHGRIGRARVELGDIEGARKSYAIACELDPRSIVLWCALTDVTKVVPGDHFFPILGDLLSGCRPSDFQNRARVCFALAKAFSDIGESDRSFSYYMEGNRLQRRQVQYDEASMLGAIARTRELYSPTIARRCEGGANASPLPIFIVGMPRTGSTLVEQILANHNRIIALGELAAFQQAVSALDQKKGLLFPEWLPSLDAADVAGLADNYLERLSTIARTQYPSFDPVEGTRVVDKMLGNFRYLGLIHLALPNARIIRVRRDPVDTCLSCFQNLFDAMTMPFTYDLGELGRFYRQYEDLMEAWSTALPANSFLTIDYESLVRDFENTARKIVSYCELEWDDGCLSFYKSDRPVRTASASQVRRPLYASSVGKWRPAENVLRPLLDALQRS